MCICGGNHHSKGSLTPRKRWPHTRPMGPFSREPVPVHNYPAVRMSRVRPDLDSSSWGLAGPELRAESGLKNFPNAKTMTNSFTLSTLREMIYLKSQEARNKSNLGWKKVLGVVFRVLLFKKTPGYLPEWGLSKWLVPQIKIHSALKDSN